MTSFGKALAFVAFLIVNGQRVATSFSTAAPPAQVSHYERPTKSTDPFKERVIVFVHGIFGDAAGTWRASSGVYWPALLIGDDVFNSYDIYVADYESPYFGNTMTVDEVVNSLNSRLIADGVFSKHHEVVFVCHSLGGIIIQRLLLTYREYAKQVPFIYFFATPETGSQMAKLGSVFSADPLLQAMFPGENAYLLNLENEWKAAHLKIRRYCAYEKKPYHGILIVDRLSGTRNCDEPPMPINEDHVGIVKPGDRNHQSYIALQNAVRENVAIRRPTTTPSTSAGNNSGKTSQTTSHPNDNSQSQIAQELAEIRKELTTPQGNKPCHVENGQLVGCTDSDIIDWGKPLLQRLEEAIQSNEKSVIERHKRYQSQDDLMARGEKLDENIRLNRYLEKDCGNFVIYRAAVVSRLRGGDSEPHPELKYLSDKITREGGLSHQFSEFNEAQSISEDLRDLSNRLSRQIPQVGKHEDWLTDTQKEKITSVLKERSHVKGSVRIVRIGTPVPKYADQIFEAIKAADWQVDTFDISAASTQQEPASPFLVGPNLNAPSFQAVSAALANADIAASIYPNHDSMNPISAGIPDVTIVIRAKQP